MWTFGYSWFMIGTGITQFLMVAFLTTVGLDPLPFDWLGIIIALPLLLLLVVLQMLGLIPNPWPWLL